MDTTGGKGRPTNLYDKFVATRDERFQAYADQALLDQGIDPTQLGADSKDTHHNYTFGAELHFKQNYTFGFEQNYTFGAELHSCVEITCIFYSCGH